MAKCTALILLILCLALAPIALEAKEFSRFGVAFSLPLDYGYVIAFFSVASVYGPDGIIGIIKAEGTPEYKDMMRAQNRSFTNPDDYSDDSYRDVWRGQPLPLGLRLSPWYREPMRDPRARIISPMLKTLKVAAESYTGESVKTVPIIFPFYILESLRNATIWAGSDLSLNLEVMEGPSGIWAAAEMGYGDSCSGLRQSILTVDYSRAALTAMLLREKDCTGLEVVQGLHDTSFGRNNWSSETRCTLEQELRKLIGVPKAGAVGPRGERIDAVLISGEASDDLRLQEVLRDVLRFDAALGSTTIIGKDRYTRSGTKFDPLFTVTNQLASDNHMHVLQEEGLFF